MRRSAAWRAHKRGALFANPGKSQGGNRLVPDYLVRFDISPRNLNLER